MAFFLCSKKIILLLFIISAIPIAYIVTLETTKPTTHTYHYHSAGWLRDCVKWDDLNRRFLVSYLEGGVGQIPVPKFHSPGTVLDEVVVIKDVDVAGNASFGINVDVARNRVLVVIADVIGNRYAALAAYDLSTWERLFLTQLSGPGDEKSFANDVAVDHEGIAYVTDAKASKIWKVSLNGTLQSIIKNPLFTSEKWYKNLLALNGIIYHPNGYLLVIHTANGNLYKIETKNNELVKLVKLVGEGSLLFGDGLELLSPTILVVVGNPYSKLVESTDGWESASVVGYFAGPAYRFATSATVKDEKVYVSHMFGMGYPRKKHAIVEAVFSKGNLKG